MGASYGKVTLAHKEAIYDLKKKGTPGRVIQEKLKAGYNATGDIAEALDPVDLSVSECNRIGKRLMDERDDLFTSRVQTKAPPEALVLLAKRLIVVAERETVRLEAAVKAGRLDANKLGRLATALVRLYALVERSEAPGAGRDDPPSNPTDQGAEPPPSSFADTLVSDDGGEGVPEGQDEPATGAPAAVADVSLTASGAVQGRPPASAQAVPSDLPETGDAGGGNGATA